MTCVNSHDVIQKYELTYVYSHDKKYIRIHINEFVCNNSYSKKQRTNLYIQIHINLPKDSLSSLSSSPR